MDFPKKKIVLQKLNKTVGTGWLTPSPDPRDYAPDHPTIKPILDQMRNKQKLALATNPSPPLGSLPKVDLREYCSPVEDQGELGSCSAHAGVGIVEYFERRASDAWIEGSRRFLYKTTRNLMQRTGDTGAWLRHVIAALRFCGVAPERYWPYTDKTPDFDEEPTAFVYAVADEYKALKYFCHDPLSENIDRQKVLESVKDCLRLGIPSMFGFFVYPSFGETNRPGDIPYPCPFEFPQWGHCVVAVGYDDNWDITNKQCPNDPNATTRGALLIRNSWGTDWGDKGYGYLPYKYVEDNLAFDFWSLLDMKWANSNSFYP